MKLKLYILISFVLSTILVIGHCQPVQGEDEDLFELPVVHINDFHARFEETEADASPCKEDDVHAHDHPVPAICQSGNCIGGLARVYTAIKELLKRPNAILLDAGDDFQGTLWYNLYRWNATQYFLNQIPFDAHTIGNHEFDNGIKGLVPFMDRLKAPVVIANIDDTLEPDFQGRYKKSTIIERDGKKIGVIGAIFKGTDMLSQTEKLKFLDEVESINLEAESLVKEENCTIIIALTHCGLQVDLEIAKYLGPHVNLIVGGHSHTLLYNGTVPSPDKAEGTYPMVVERENGRKVLVVQAYSFARYVGNLIVRYNANGDIVNWEGNPVYLGRDVKPDSEMQTLIDVWKEDVHKYGDRVIGNTKVLLDDAPVHRAESNLGNFIADAMMSYYIPLNKNSDSWSPAALALVNSGVIRSTIFKGNITYSDMMSCIPFDNSIDIGELKGEYIKDALEFAVNTTAVHSRYRKFLSDELWIRQFLQLSGFRIVYDFSKPVGSRIISLRIRCRDCDVPHYEPYKPDEMYPIILVGYLASGGDGFSMVKNNLKNHQVGPAFNEVVENYIKQMSPITQGLEDRIVILNAE